MVHWNPQFYELNNMSDQSQQSEVPSFALPLAPLVPWYIRRWKLLVAGGLIAITCASVFGAWKYHEYMNEKYANLKVEVEQYKVENTTLKDRIVTNEAEIARAKEQAQQFNSDLEAIKRSNNELRNKIGRMGVTVVTGSDPATAQQTLDEIRNESNNRWKNIGKPE